MFDLARTIQRSGVFFAVALTLVGTASSDAAGERYGLGKPASAEEIAGWDIDVRPDGLGLPDGRGTAEEGEELYVAQCAACHGEFGEAIGRYPVLMGGQGTLTSEDPVKTVGSYWPYASTVFDYIRRAMPFGHAQSLTPDQTYAITAFVLNLNEIVEYEQEVNRQNLASIEMPNRDGFIQDQRPDTPLGEPCMRDCRGELQVIGKARIIDVTPERERTKGAVTTAVTGQENAVDPALVEAGKKIFVVCGACHAVDSSEHKIGPSLKGIYGRQAGSAEGFERYSAALAGSGVTWDDESLAKYVQSPQAFISGTNMPFAGIPSEQDVEKLLAYLRVATK